MTSAETTIQEIIDTFTSPRSSAMLVLTRVRTEASSRDTGCSSR